MFSDCLEQTVLAAISKSKLVKGKLTLQFVISDKDELNNNLVDSNFIFGLTSKQYSFPIVPRLPSFHIHNSDFLGEKCDAEYCMLQSLTC